MRWQVSKLGEFYDRDEDTIVYFDRASGDTHLLSTFAGSLLQELGERTMTVEELASILPKEAAAVDTDQFEQAVKAVLEDLSVLDIIERC
ncbi:MAG: HPr-rel-A system PqqD family peptide chaperone [Pseudomonadota bacterium]